VTDAAHTFTEAAEIAIASLGERHGAMRLTSESELDAMRGSLARHG
jgi:hypothetical protein